MANYLLDTNHASPLVTIGHPLRNKILGSVDISDFMSFRGGNDEKSLLSCF
jgi:hypothetical protein